MSTDRTLPVTPTERTAAAMLRAWQAWKPDMTDRGPVHHMLVMFGTAAAVADLVDAETDDLTPAGRELLARVGAAERTAWDALPAKERIGYLAYLADDARDVRNDKTDFGPRWIRILRAVSDALARPDAPSAFPPKRKPER